MAASTSSAVALSRQPTPQRSWLHPDPLRDGDAPDARRTCRRRGPARATAIRTSSPPRARACADQRGLGLERHGVDDEPAARLQRRHRPPRYARSPAPPPMKTASGAGKVDEGRRRVSLNALRGAGTPKAAALRAMRAARSARASIAIARSRDRRASIRWRSSRRRRRCPTATRRRRGASERQRDRADLALGDLPVVLEQLVGQARREGDDASARHRRRPRSRRCSIRRSLQASSAQQPKRRIRSRSAAERFEDGRREGAEPRLRDRPASAAGPSPSRGQRQDGRTGMEMRADAV